MSRRSIGCCMGAMLGLTVHMPLYYEVVYRLTAAEAGLALIPIAAVSVLGPLIVGRTMAKAVHYKRIAIFGTSVAAVIGPDILLLTPLPLWQLLKRRAAGWIERRRVSAASISVTAGAWGDGYRFARPILQLRAARFMQSSSIPTNLQAMFNRDPMQSKVVLAGERAGI